jgi:glycogen debranching enzyme
MKEDGFNIEIKVDWNTGLLLGGNRHNCGTWMDKMGESQKAGNKGVPGTPRDGAPVEITGLLKSALRWLVELSDAGDFPFQGVQVNRKSFPSARLGYSSFRSSVHGRQQLVTYKEWNALVQQSFEKYYYIPLGKRIFTLDITTADGVA